MWNEVRMLIAEWFLGLAMKFCPNNDEGFELVLAIMQYLEKKLERKDSK